MKKIVFGTLITFVGIVLSVCCFIHASNHPWTHNGIDVLLGSFLGTETLVPFIMGIVLILAGLVICFIESYINNK